MTGHLQRAQPSPTTLTVDESLPATGIETVHIGLAGVLALILGSLVLVITSRRRDDEDPVRLQ